MAKVYMICGKICSGKSTYCKGLAKETGAVILSIDEITLLFGQYLGDSHDEFVKKAEQYLLYKAIECAENNINVILDWGFWQKKQRDKTKQFFFAKGIPVEIHYLDIDDKEWHERIEKRNADVISGNLNAYYIDNNIMAKFESRFEKPDENEVNLVIKQ